MTDDILSRSTIEAKNREIGKTKSIELLEDPTLIRLRTKDALTANDAAVKADLPVAKDKTTQNCCVMYYLKKHDIPVAYVSRNDDTSFIAADCIMIPVEFVIRRRPFGSYLKRHPGASSSDLFDPPLTELFHKYAVIPPCGHHKNIHAIFETTRQIPEYRARELYMENGHWTHKVYTDPLMIATSETSWDLYPAKVPFSNESLMSILPLLKPHELNYIREKIMLPTFEILEKAWQKVKVSLIDLKIEIGYHKKTKELVLADVIDNDSWRIWPHGDPKNQLDKQAFRDGEELTEVQRKYRIVTEYVKKF